MLGGSLVQLLRAMFQRTLGQKVDDTATTLANPVDGLMPVNKT